MADLTGPASYLEKLQFAQRVVRNAKFRSDQKQALRELGEGLYEVILALLNREEGKEPPPATQPQQAPTVNTVEQKP
jgi:hypothetical protein